MPSNDPIPLNVPDIGRAERIELVCWNIKNGDSVAQNQELCELVTDKAAFPLECPRNGVVVKLLKEAGAEVSVGETLALLQTGVE